MECLSLSMLLKYLRGQESNSQHILIYAHTFLLKGCPVCQENLQLLQTIINAAAQDKSFEFSEETLAAIVAKFKEQKATAPQPIRQIVAELIFDSGLLLQFAKARFPSEKAVCRQSLYRAEGYNIDLLFVFSKETDDERLIGQVLPQHCDAPELPQLKVQVLQHGSELSATNTDARGEFVFSRLTSAAYDLKVSVPDGEINLERVPTARSL